VNHGLQFTPASFRRAFFILALAAVCAPAGLLAQPGYRPAPNYAQPAKPDQAEGRRILEEFRDTGIAGDYFLQFQLRVMPRRGDERLYAGQLWVGRGQQGAISRVSLTVDGVERRLLLQDGVQPAVWSWQAGPHAQVAMLDITALFSPLADTDFTPFDLERPYLYWTDFVYEGLTRISGRPAYQFLLYPPADFAAKYPALTGVRLYLDSQFKQPMQTEQIGAAGQPLKSMAVQELKKVGDQWIPKTIDLRNEITRDKTRFQVTGAALGQTLPAEIFAPAALAEVAPPPVPASVTKINP
jgi:hypothetical protein